MHKKSNTYSSSTPLRSSSNMTGYYMGSSPSLMTMMQTGGDAAIARAKQGVKEIKALESAQEKEAKRQAKGSLFGSALGIGGGLLAAALAPATGGLSLLAPAIGTAIGKGVGERIGAGRARRSEQPSDTFFYGKDFEDIDEASEEYNQGMLERAGVSGLKALLTAGLAPDGGMYGTVAGKLRPDKLAGVGMEGASAVATQAVDPYAQLGLLNPTATLPKSSIAPSTSGFSLQPDTQGLYDTSQQFNELALNIAEKEAAGSAAYADTLEYLNTPEGRSSLLASDGGQALMSLDSGSTPDFNLIEALGVSIPKASPDVDLSNNFFNPASYEDTLSASNAIGQENAVLEALRSIQESKDSLARSATLQGNLEKYYQSLGTEAPAFVNREGGGLINYEEGGPIMERAGGFGSGTFTNTPNPYSYYTPPTGFDPTQDSEKGQFSSSVSDTASYNTNVKDIATSMFLNIDDDAAKYYEGFDYGEVNPLIRSTRGDLEQAKSDTTELIAKQNFSGSGEQQQSLLDLTQASSDIASEAREKSAEDYQERIKEQLAADIGLDSGVTEMTPDEIAEQLAATPVPTNDPNWNPPANAMPNTDYSFGDQIWQFRRQVGPGGAQGEGRWIRIS